jgi:hypothetical protein
LLPPFLLSLFLLAGPTAQAKPKFNASEVAGTGQQLMTCDLDGDGLKDLVLMDDTNLSIFYQDPQQGFTREPQQTYQLEPRPCVVWTAKLGGPAGSLLVMTSDGVTELDFTNRTGPPARRQIIRQATLVPEATQGTNNVICLPLSAETGGDRPLLLVPAADGLQVWSSHGPSGWQPTQVIGSAVKIRPQLSAVAAGYTNFLELNLVIGDVNGGGRDDLMVRRTNPGGTNAYCLYLQQTNGWFTPEPALTYADKQDLFSWLDWIDLNRDGKVDLVKGVFLNEPSFVPGVPSGKVLVSTFIADSSGRIPAAPQQVFRKDDWSAALPVVDVDGDGYPDLVLGYVPMDVRENLRKEITARLIDYQLWFYFFRPGEGFPGEADCQRTVAIHVDRNTGPLDWSLAEGFQRLVHVGGDFNGDGKADLLVRDHADSISVYFFQSREKGFSPEPDLRFTCPEPVEDWQIADLNHDGISDLIVKLDHEKGWRIFISRK